MMEKNMLVLYGSPRERGFTKELLKIFIQEWENVYPNTNIYTFHAYQENMAPCTACVVAGLLMAFTMSIDDFVISFFTTGPGVTNLSIEIYSMARKGINPSINALSTLMFLTVLILLLIVNRKEFTSRGE